MDEPSVGIINRVREEKANGEGGVAGRGPSTTLRFGRDDKPSGMGLEEVEFCAEPGGGEGADDEGDGIPVRAEGRNVIPSGDGADRCEDGADGAADESVHHGAIGGETRCDVAADDAVNGAIDSGPDEDGAGSVFPERRIEMNFVEKVVGEERDGNDDDEADDDAHYAAAEGAFGSGVCGSGQRWFGRFGYFIHGGGSVDGAIAREGITDRMLKPTPREAVDAGGN